MSQTIYLRHTMTLFLQPSPLHVQHSRSFPVSSARGAHFACCCCCFSCGSQLRHAGSSCIMQDVSLQHMSALVAALRFTCPTACGNSVSLIRDPIHVPCIERRILNHQTTREVPRNTYLKVRSQCQNLPEVSKILAVLHRKANVQERVGEQQLTCVPHLAVNKCVLGQHLTKYFHRPVLPKGTLALNGESTSPK